jgi:hypothetical protein
MPCFYLRHCENKVFGFQGKYKPELINYGQKIGTIIVNFTVLLILGS